MTDATSASKMGCQISDYAKRNTYSFKRQWTNDDSSDGDHDYNDKHVSNWGLDLRVATRTENRYKELQTIQQLSQVKSLPTIKSYLAGSAPSTVKNILNYNRCTKICYTTHGHVVYLASTIYIHMYKSTIDTWYKLPDCPCPFRDVFAIITIKGELTAIGGDNKLYTLTGQGAKQQWTEEYPPLPVDRYMYSLTAICVGEALIVFSTADVLIMNIQSKRWTIATHSLLVDRPQVEPQVEF